MLEIMRKRLLFCLAYAAIMMVGVSCDPFGEGREGYMSLRFVSDNYAESKSLAETKSSVELPDTNDFILTVTKSDGAVVYSGKYGASPESILVSAGTYDVKVVSSEFSKPQFDCPQFGDEQCVVVNAGGVAKVELVCRQINSGMKLNVSPSFLTAYPDGTLHLKSSDGKLLYAYKEKRVAYFNPGNVSLILANNGTETTLLSKTLMSQEILTLNVAVAASANNSSNDDGGVRVSVDTTRNWNSENVSIGGGGSTSGGNDYDSAYSITEAKNHIGETNVWVCGYIVGGDMTSSANGIKFLSPFSSATHLAIASRSSVTTKSSCMSVQLPSGDIRTALNLVSNPSNIGKKVFLKGEIVAAYYGIPGVKNVTDFVLK